MEKIAVTLTTASLLMLAGCASSGQLSNSSPNSGYYPQPSNTFYDAYPHKDRHDPTSELFISNHEGELIENPNYIPPTFPR